MVAWVLLVCASIGAQAQLNNHLRDSLLNELALRSGPSERLAPLKDLCWSYLFSDKALPYLHELDSLTALLATDPDSIVRRTALGFRSCMYYQRGYLHKFRRNMVAAQQDFREAVRTGRANRDTLNIANGLSALGASYLALDMPAQALRYYDEELALIQATAEKSHMYTSDIHIHQAEALMRLGRFDEARNTLMRTDTSTFGRHALTLMGLGQLEAFEGDTMEALSVMARAVHIMRATKQPWDLLSILQPIGRLQLKAHRTSEALTTLTEAIILARTIGDDAALAGCLVIAGRAQMILGDAGSAEGAYREAMDIAQQHGFVGIARESGDDGGVVHAAEALFNLYKVQGRAADALFIAEQWVNWKDSLHRMEGREELLRFELQQAQLTDSIADAQRVQEATQELRLVLESERTQRKFLLALGAAVLSLVSFAIYFLLNRRERERNKATTALQRREQERMIHDLRMRELMSEDLHEELGAGLSALKLWSEMDLSEEADPHRRQLLAKRSAMADELVMSLRQIVWAMNSPNTTVKQLVDYLMDHAHLHCAQRGLRLHAECSCDWPLLYLGPEQRRNPFLVLKEALNNTVEHSGASRVELRITWEDALPIDIRDNGKGTTTDPDQLPGNGLRKMKRRIAAIGGDSQLNGIGGYACADQDPFPVSRW